MVESGLKHHNPNPNSDSELDMEHYTKLHGYTTDDPEQFLSDFEAYIIFIKLKCIEQRILVAFQLNLYGPAQVWYSSLDIEDKLKMGYCSTEVQRGMTSEQTSFISRNIFFLQNLRLF